ncbi:hypothetical protein F5I97DRAFT_1791076, partial [Phlebopus sp. FC_14]
LEEQVTLQLKCMGSCSKLNHKANVRVQLGLIDMTVYVDIVNINQYYCILRTSFLHTFGIKIDFVMDALVL